MRSTKRMAGPVLSARLAQIRRSRAGYRPEDMEARLADARSAIIYEAMLHQMQR